MKSDNVQFLSNKSVRYGFDRNTGRLLSVINRATGNDCLLGKSRAGNIFSVYYDLSKEFEIVGDPGMTPYSAPMPLEYCRRVFSPQGGHVVSIVEKKVRKSVPIAYVDVCRLRRTVAGQALRHP